MLNVAKEFNNLEAATQLRKKRSVVVNSITKNSDIILESLLCLNMIHLKKPPS